jgi:hypothetical protein
VAIIAIAAVGMGGVCAGGILVVINHPPPPLAVVFGAVFIVLAVRVRRWTQTDEDEASDIHDVVCELLRMGRRWRARVLRRGGSGGRRYSEPMLTVWSWAKPQSSSWAA